MSLPPAATVAEKPGRANLMKRFLATSAAGAIAAATLFSSAGAVNAASAPSAAGVSFSSSQKAIAAQIYVQAKGLGLDDNAALIGILDGLAETNLRNLATGDYWASCPTKMTPARGVFQLYGAAWAPRGTAWSGKKVSEAKCAGTNAFTAATAWISGGWAVRDPRMNVGQASNLLFLGSTVNEASGVEDNKTYRGIFGKATSKVSNATYASITQQVAGVPSASLAPYYTAKAAVARTLLSYVKSLPAASLPGFVSPTYNIALRAATNGPAKSVFTNINMANYYAGVYDAKIQSVTKTFKNAGAAASSNHVWAWVYEVAGGKGEIALLPGAGSVPSGNLFFDAGEYTRGVSISSSGYKAGAVTSARGVPFCITVDYKGFRSTIVDGAGADFNSIECTSTGSAA